MADGQTASELPECPTEGAEDQDVHAKPEVPSSSSSVTEEPSSSQSSSKQPSPGLLSMPCLLQELRRDSSAEPLPPETSTTPAVAQLRPQEDSDSSACLRSPSSSGHLGDSDTLSSAEGEDVELVDTDLAPSSQTDPLTAPRKSSRRLRSESDASAGLGMAAKKNRCQERQANGGKVRARGQRSQRQKERMRLLRQKREAVAKRKPRLLQDSSTSDSDATAQSSSTDSSDNEGDTVLHPPVGPAVIGHYDVSDTNSEREQQQPHILSGPVAVEPPQVSLALSDSEVEIVGVQENPRFPRGGVIQSLSAWKQSMMPSWTAVSAQPDWAPPTEVVDLTLDEDRHRYLL
ncbi:uncharacterized protein C18orf25 homolog isoform X1 [Trichomycterus rosablanca]|uniref:uncharacterized protein C18orf25 homolog isoform X1 n=1 Tax=Trichomycterus rosablanca TaxID=2290929 RepID=UPI002F358146